MNIKLGYKNVLFFVLLAALWGVAFMAIRAGLEYFPPVLFAAIRYDLAAIILFAYAVLVSDTWIPQNRAAWIVVIIDGLFLVALYNFFVFIGQQTVISAVGAIIVGLNPILATVFSRMLLPDERLTTFGIIGLLVGFIGIIFIAQPTFGNILTDSVIGQLMILLGTISFAFGSVLVQNIDDNGISTEGVTAWSCLIGALVLHGLSISAGESVGAIEWTTSGVLALGYLVVGSSAIGYFIYFDLLDQLGPIEINLVSYVVPIFAAVSGWLVLQETVDMFTLIGFVLIFIGFVIIKRSELQKEMTHILRVARGIR